MERETAAAGGTIDPDEVERFSRLAGQWWDPHGPMAALHKFNPVRLGYIRDIAAAHFGRDAKRLGSLAGLRLLDIGCGGGLLCEPLARLGAAVVGADPSEQQHCGGAAPCRAVGLNDRLPQGQPPRRWQRPVKPSTLFSPWKWSSMSPTSACSSMLRRRWSKPGGLLFVATLNRTAKSFALAIVGAEYILRWLPRGTHQWDKFVTPDELEIAIEQGGLHITDETGVIYNLFADRWQLRRRHGRELHGGRGEGRRDALRGPWLWAVFHRHRRLHSDAPQRGATRTDQKPRHRRRDPCAVSVRTALRAHFSCRRHAGERNAIAAAGIDFLAVDPAWGAAHRSPPPRSCSLPWTSVRSSSPLPI